MKGLKLTFACVALALFFSRVAAAQSGVFSGQGRYQQQATTSCPSDVECVLALRKVPKGKQVVTTGLSCEEIPLFPPYFEVYNETTLLFRVGLSGVAYETRLMSLILDPQHTLTFKARGHNALTKNLSCLITGMIADKS